MTRHALFPRNLPVYAYVTNNISLPSALLPSALLFSNLCTVLFTCESLFIMPAMVRFFDPYYLANTALALVYLLLRVYFIRVTPEGSQYSRLKTLDEFFSYERQALLTVLAVAVWKGLRRRSWDHFAQQFFFFAKLVVAVMAVMVDMRLFLWYSVLLLATWIAFPQPIVHFAGNSPDQKDLVQLNPSKFKGLVQRGDGDWLVFFYTESHDDSIAMAPAFAELADQYAGRCSFGCLDACLWPKFSKDLNIRPNSWSNQLPAVVMYRNGKEVGRIPAAAQTDELGFRRNFYTKRDVVKKFNLDDVVPDSVSNKPKSNGKQKT